MITFHVSDVAVSGDAFEPLSLAEALAERGLDTLEATSLKDVPLVRCAPYHGLLMAANLAYAHHLPLTLSPDHIWLCIAQAAARHILLHADEARERWVRHSGKVALVVDRHTFVRGSADNDWQGVVEEFSEKLHSHLGRRHGLLVCDFSTTGLAERTASEIVLMSAMQKYFVYVVRTLCGIPSITLEGEPADWRAIVERARALEVLGADDWLSSLIPVLERVEATSRGDVDVVFWENFFKRIEGSGGACVSGWINVLFPYLGDDIDIEKRNPMVFQYQGDWGVPSDEEDWVQAPKITDFPLGVARAPFTWQLYSDRLPMQFIAGFVGVEHKARTQALRPHVAWAVCPDQPERDFICAVDGMVREGESPPVTVQPLRRDTLASLANLRTETEGLERCVVDLWTCPALTSLAGAGGDALSLKVWGCDALASLEGIEGLHKLITLRLSSCPKLETLAPLQDHPSLEHLWLMGCQGLTDIQAVASLRSLKSCVIFRSPMLHDLSPLAYLPQLERLELRHCPGIPEGLAVEHAGRDAVRQIQHLLLPRIRPPTHARQPFHSHPPMPEVHSWAGIGREGHRFNV
ncbi:MAG: DUF4419 domain-containing protein [Myxococcota bacterium]